jgi:hypothetical protein
MYTFEHAYSGETAAHVKRHCHRLKQPLMPGSVLSLRIALVRLSAINDLIHRRNYAAVHRRRPCIAHI